MIRRRLFAWTALLGIGAAPALAQTPTETVRYYHADEIGSVRAVTNEAGQVVAQHDYLPFGGEPADAPDRSPLRFTGKERDRETGLDYFGARYYANQMGRFTGVDPFLNIEAAPGDPQQWNRYVYARNNPLIFNDPTGLDCVYANSSGDGVGSIDHDGNATTCARNSGTWVPGTIADGNALYNARTHLFQVASTDGGNVYYATFAAGAQTDASGACVSGCHGADIQHAAATWLQSMAESQGGTLSDMMTFMVQRQEPLHGGFFNKIASGPLAFWNNHWAGPGGMGPPHGRGDWTAMAHDYAFSLSGITIGNYFSVTMSPEKSGALIHANSMLIKNAGGAQAAKMGAVFGVVNLFQWYRNTWR